jgi:lysophospholipase L1-like esterase
MSKLSINRSLDMFIGSMRQSFGDPDAWRKSIHRFETDDKVNPPAPGGIVFVGSSSFTFWSTMAQDLAPLPVINRGFGGAMIEDVIRYIDRIIIPYQPRAVVLFAGANDIVGPRAKSPKHVAELFRTFVGRVHENLPEALIFYIAITPTPAGWKWWPSAKETNRLISQIVSSDPRLRFIDLSDVLLSTDKLPERSLYGSSRHLNELGYERWTSSIKPILEKELLREARISGDTPGA